MGRSYLGQIVHGEDVGQRGLAPVAPGLAVDGHTVLPLVRQQHAGVVAVLTREEVAVCAARVRTPAVVRHHRVPAARRTQTRGEDLFIFYTESVRASEDKDGKEKRLMRLYFT